MEQIFSNGDKVHVGKVLGRLGLEGCFDEIICFETLNPPLRYDAGNDESHMNDTYVDPNASTFPPSPILCKPQEIAFEVALKQADIDPRKTVSFSGQFSLPFYSSIVVLCLPNTFP